MGYNGWTKHTFPLQAPCPSTVKEVESEREEVGRGLRYASDSAEEFASRWDEFDFLSFFFFFLMYHPFSVICGATPSHSYIGPCFPSYVAYTRLIHLVLTRPPSSTRSHTWQPSVRRTRPPPSCLFCASPLCLLYVPLLALSFFSSRSAFIFVSLYLLDGRTVSGFLSVLFSRFPQLPF
jgi:hypothetical protein